MKKSNFIYTGSNFTYKFFLREKTNRAHYSKTDFYHIRGGSQGFESFKRYSRFFSFKK